MDQYQSFLGEGRSLGQPGPVADFDPSVIASRGYRRHEWIGRHRNLGEAVYVYNQVNSRRYPTSWPHREAEPMMTRYRERVRAMLTRTGPRLSICLAVMPHEHAELPGALDALLAAAAPLGERVELVVLIGMADNRSPASHSEAERLLGRHHGDPRLRAFTHRAPVGRVPSVNAASLLAMGRRLVPINVSDRPRTAELAALIAGPTDHCAIATPIERPPATAPWPAVDRQMYHAFGGFDERLSPGLAALDLTRRIAGRPPMHAHRELRSQPSQRCGPFGFGVPAAPVERSR